MHERVIGAQPLIIADEAFAVKIAWLIDCRIPTLGGHAQVGSQRLQVAVKLRQIGIDQCMLWIGARVEERDAQHAIRRDRELGLKLLRAVADRIIVHAHGLGPGFALVMRGDQQHIRVAVPIVTPGDIEFSRSRIAGESGQGRIAIVHAGEMAGQIADGGGQHRRCPGGAAVR